MRNRALLAAVAAALLSACAAQAPAPEGRAAPGASVAAVQSEAQRLNELVEAYFEEQLKLRPLMATSIGDKRYNDRLPDLSPAARERQQAAVRASLATLEVIDRAALSPADQLNYDIYRRQLETEIAGFRFWATSGDGEATMGETLAAAGARIELFEDGCAIDGPTALKGVSVKTRLDHRIAMSMAVAQLLADGAPVHLDDVACVATSFPSFFRLLDEVTGGAR